MLLAIQNAAHPSRNQSSASQVPGLTEWDILTRWGFIQGCQELLWNFRESFREFLWDLVIILACVRVIKGCKSMEVPFLSTAQGEGVLILGKAVDTDYLRLRYQLGISMESGSSSGAEREPSASTTTTKHPQEVTIIGTALTLQDLAVEGTDRPCTGRSTFSQLQGGLPGLGTLSWQLTHEVLKPWRAHTTCGQVSPGVWPGGWITSAGRRITQC